MLYSLLHSFPVQLLRNHLKRNRMLLCFWLVLFGIVNGNFGGFLGLHYLILDPEYLHQSDFWSFFIMGAAVGGFTMAFHITTYIIDIHRFPFVGALSRPFAKFCLNNSPIPLVFMLTYSIAVVRFQWLEQQNTPEEVATKVVGLLAGFTTVACLTFVYVVITDQDVFGYLGKSKVRQLQQALFYRLNLVRRLLALQDNKFTVESYFETPLKIGYTKNLSKYYHPSIVVRLFSQNQFNLVLFELFAIALLLSLGFFGHYSFSKIPAAASGILLLTILVMLTGLLSFWMRGWVTTTLIVLAIAINGLVKHELLVGSRDSQAVGLNYGTDKAVYSLEQMRKMNSSQYYQEDKQATLAILNNWRQKFPADKPPKLVMVCASGGGQKAALWTLKVLQAADSMTHGKLMEHTMLMSCVSGGAFGASYFRELCLRKKLGEAVDPYSQEYLDRIARNSLNPIIFNLVTNDILLDINTCQYQGKAYRRDRGYAVEDQINMHTDHMLEKPLEAYRAPERQSLIPMLLLTPILNDGRKLFISPHNMSYMGTHFMDGPCTSDSQKIKGVDFMRFFERQQAGQLRFLSAIRIGATYPYILPSVGLPSTPTLYAMDAGLADNFGIADTMHFLCVFRDWILKHTAGVVLVVIRSSAKEQELEAQAPASWFQKLTYPATIFQNSWTKIQDIRNDGLIELATTCYGHHLVEVEFPYMPTQQKKARRSRFKEASLSWHLTAEERQDILEAIQSTCNQQALRQLQQLLK